MTAQPPTDRDDQIARMSHRQPLPTRKDPAGDDSTTPDQEIVEQGPGQPEWWYCQKRRRNKERVYRGIVTVVHGAQARELADVQAMAIAALLRWAHTGRRTGPDAGEPARDIGSAPTEEDRAA
jgi:hypothetical protein